MGETLALLTAEDYGRLGRNRDLRLSFGGCESNVAIGLSRLGVSTHWIGRVGDDVFGQMIERELRAEGVRPLAIRDTEARTSLMVKERVSREITNILYYRRGLAGSRLELDDVDVGTIGSAEILHVSGITASLSDQMPHFLESLMKRARSAGTLVSLDLNYRASLWDVPAAHDAYQKLIPQADIVFGGVKEAHVATGCPGGPQEVLNALYELGPDECVLTLGSDGAISKVDGLVYRQTAPVVDPVDSVGAGDAFVAGYLSSMLVSGTSQERLELGTRTGTYNCMTVGDWEGMPTLAELERWNQIAGVQR